MEVFSSLSQLLAPYVIWLGWISLAMFVLSLLLVPALLSRIPPDYFVRQTFDHQSSTKIAGIHYSLLWVGRNLLGTVLILAGVLMLILPGQGLLTIFLGLFVADFPGKKRLERRLVSVPAIHRSINWIREKRGVEELALPPALKRP
jgi:hypothetical protein